MNVLLFGPPGAGKGTQAYYISQQFQLPLIATGEMLRTAVANKTPLGLEAGRIMATGALLPDGLIIDLVKQRIAQPDCAKGFLLDGFPRTLAQAAALQDANVLLDVVLVLNVPDAVIIERLSGRRVHLPSGRVYHLKNSPPKVAGLDDITQEPLVQREDDLESTVVKRLSVFHEQTEPVKRFYQTHAGAGAATHYYKELDGCGDVLNVREKIAHFLQSCSV